MTRRNRGRPRAASLNCGCFLAKKYFDKEVLATSGQLKWPFILMVDANYLVYWPTLLKFTLNCLFWWAILTHCFSKLHFRLNHLKFWHLFYRVLNTLYFDGFLRTNLLQIILFLIQGDRTHWLIYKICQNEFNKKQKKGS